MAKKIFKIYFLIMTLIWIFFEGYLFMRNKAKEAGSQAAIKDTIASIMMYENKTGAFHFKKYKCDLFKEITCDTNIKGSTLNSVSNFSYQDLEEGLLEVDESVYQYNAPDQLYRLDISESKQLTVYLKNKSAADLDLFLINPCNQTEEGNITCAETSTAGGNADEAIGPIHFEKGTYFFLVDGHNVKQQGAYELSVVCNF